MEAELWNWIMGRNWKNFKAHDIKSLNCLDETISASVEIKGELSRGNEEHVIEYYRKCGTCYKAADNLTELQSTIVWKAEISRDKFGYLAQDISKKSIADMAWFIIDNFSKMQEKRSKLREELLKKK